MARFKRILLKLSGESLMGKQGYGIDPERLSDYANQIKEVAEMGVPIGIVIGGGNIFRGLSGSQKGFDSLPFRVELTYRLHADGCHHLVLHTNSTQGTTQSQ